MSFRFLCDFSLFLCFLCFLPFSYTYYYYDNNYGYGGGWYEDGLSGKHISEFSIRSLARRIRLCDCHLRSSNGYHNDSPFTHGHCSLILHLHTCRSRQRPLCPCRTRRRASGIGRRTRRHHHQSGICKFQEHSRTSQSISKMLIV